MRGIETQVRKVRRRVFKEIADLAYHSENLIDDMEALPYKIVPGEDNEYWESVYRERAVVRERIRLAMGMSLRPEDAPVHVSQGVEESNIAEKYYEPPLLQVIPSACNACPENQYEVTNKCMGCLAHPCNEVCPRGAITMVHGKSYIDQEKCIKCVNVSQSVLMMRFRIRSVLVRVRAVLVRSRVTAKDELRSIMICVFPAVSVW